MAGFTLVGDQTKVAHFLQVKSALKIEVNTGMKFSNRGSVLQMAKQCGYTDKNTKAAALKQMEASYKDWLAEYN